MLPTQDLPPAVAVRRMATAYWVSEALHAAASLGIADRLASGPKNATQLARDTIRTATKHLMKAAKKIDNDAPAADIHTARKRATRLRFPALRAVALRPG